MWSFIKIYLICIIGINRLKEKFHRKEDLNVKAYDVWRTDAGRRTPSDGKSSPGFWPGELKIIFREEKGFSFYFLSKLKQNTNQICVSLWKIRFLIYINYLDAINREFFFRRALKNPLCFSCSHIVTF
jgi:hypothetical protein